MAACNARPVSLLCSACGISIYTDMPPLLISLLLAGALHAQSISGCHLSANRYDPLSTSNPYGVCGKPVLPDLAEQSLRQVRIANEPLQYPESVRDPGAEDLRAGRELPAPLATTLDPYC